MIPIGYHLHDIFLGLVQEQDLRVVLEDRFADVCGPRRKAASTWRIQAFSRPRYRGSRAGIDGSS